MKNENLAERIRTLIAEIIRKKATNTDVIHYVNKIEDMARQNTGFGQSIDSIIQLIYKIAYSFGLYTI
jgi:hypothetical protein